MNKYELYSTFNEYHDFFLLYCINLVFHREHQLAYSGVFYSFSKLNLKLKTRLPWLISQRA